MTWVKVCGLRSVRDVAVAVAAGADAVGFVNVPASPRFVSLADAADLARDVPVQTILLTLDMEPARLLEVLESTALDGVQPYGEHQEETAIAATEAGYFVLFPMRPEPGLDAAHVPGVPLLDTPARTQLGGTGRTFDWELAADFSGDFVLAGGLGPHNVERAIRTVHPWGVDASSGLEGSPGHKDHGMVADFITKAKISET